MNDIYQLRTVKLIRLYCRQSTRMATTILELTTRRTIITQTLYGNPSETIHSIRINTSLSEMPNPSSGGKINDDAGNIFEDYEGSDIDNVSDCSIPNIVKPESKNKQRRSHK